MRFGVLGPLEVLGDEGPIRLGGQKERTLLALLLTRPNQVAPVDTLVEGLWGDAQPRSADKTLQSYVVRLRRALEPGRARGAPGGVLVTRDRGYLLRVEAGMLDAARFEELAGRARELLAGGDPGSAAAALAEALALWRGRAFEEFADVGLIKAASEQLEELRLGAVEDRIQAELTLGRHRELIPELERLTREHPLRERFWAQLLLALYRAGRQADALLAYGRARATLVEELGIDPGAELRSLQAAILAQDPALDAPPRGEPQAATRELPTVLLDAASRPLAGRSAELAWLRATWQRAVGGHGGLAVLTGPTGMGKTRLAAELAREAHHDGAAVLYARCEPGSDALTMLASAPAAWGLPAAGPVPGVSGWAPAGVALGRRLASQAGERPLLLILDDLHQADPAMLEALARLAREAAALRVLLLGTSARDAVPDLMEWADRYGASHRRLGPLEVGEVAQVAAWYSDAAEAKRVAEALLAESGGVPALVHQVASRWARTLAARRVNEAASRTVRDRTRLRAGEVELADQLLRLGQLREQAREPLEAEPAAAGATDPATAQPAAVACPYKGLARYERDDADYFFGRERLVAELVAHLLGAGMLGVVGPSGSGKSSAVRAGLLPALAAGVLPGSGQWRQVVLRPGDHPLRELEQAAAPGGDGPRHSGGGPDRAVRTLADSGRLVLMVDQFEEVFTACQDEDERAGFVAALTAAAAAPDGYASVVVTVRADYYGACAAYPELAGLLAANHVLVGPMDDSELRRVVEGPARLAGLHLEPGLADAILADVAGEPGALPLLSTALLESWEQRRGRTMTLAAYTEGGGVRGAVARLAERAWQRLDPAEQAAARRMLLRLAGQGEGDAVVRRRVPLDEVAGGHDRVARRVLAILAHRRLVTLGEGTVEVAHEALLREWPRLRGWLEEDLQGRALHRHLTRAAREWDQAGRDPGELYRGARLTGALDWAREHDADLNDLERAFLDASRAAAEREVADAQRRAEWEARYSRRLQVVVSALAGVLAVALAAGSLALVQRGSARRAALTADARRLGAQALAEVDLDRSLLLAVAAVRLDDSVDTRGALLASLLGSPQAVRVLRGPGNRPQGLALSADGRMLAAFDNAGLAVFWDTRNGRQVGDPLLVMPGGRVAPPVYAAAFSPDGRVLASGGPDPTNRERGAVFLWEVATRRPLGKLSTSAPVFRVGFSPDGHWVVASLGATDDETAKLLVWDAATRARDGPPLDLGGTVEDPPPDIQLLDNTTLLAAGRSASIWNLASRRRIRRLPGGPAEPVAASPDGRTAALGRPDSSIDIVDLATGAHRATLPGHGVQLHGIAFSPDGASLAVGNDDRTATVWDLASGQIRETLRGHAGRVFKPAFSRDSQTLYTASLDGSVMVWDLAGSRRLGQPFTRAWAPVSWSAVQPGGAMAATGHYDGTVTLWDTTRRAPMGRPLRAHDGEVRSLMFAQSGRTLVTTGQDGNVIRWEMPAGRRIGQPLRGHTAGVGAGILSPDERLLATAADDGLINLWDAATGKLLRTLYRHPGAVFDLAFSPDGTMLGAAGEGKDAVVLRVADGVVLQRLQADRRDVHTIVFSPDGRTIATGGNAGKVLLWDPQTGSQRGPALAAQAGFILTVSYSPDSRQLAAAGTDGTVSLWDVASHKRIGTPLPGPPNIGGQAFFAADQGLVSAFEDGSLLLWNVDPAAWQAHACAVAGRDLTRQEWEEFLPGRPHRAVCPRSDPSGQP